MKNKLLKKNLINFIIKVVIWTLIFPISTYVLLTLAAKFTYQWLYNISPFLYRRLSSLFYLSFRKESIFIVLIIWLLGIIFFLYQLLKKVFSYIDSLKEVSNLLLNKEVEYIELPDDLKDIEKQINYLKRESIKNERLASEQEQRKNDLIVYLAHDLKTPLTSTIGYLSLLDEVKDMPKKQREKYISVALNKSYRLEELINELFDIARFNSETIILEKEEVNLNLMLEQIIDDFYPVLKENNKEIKLNIKDKITINADPDKLARVFSNLIKNTIYYSTDSIINIDIIKYPEYVSIVTTNKGKKIPESKLNRLFEKFYRVDSSRQSTSGGSGLGLAIAKEIIELHGGEIKATSDDEYTKFYVVLPLKDKKINIKVTS